MLFRKSVICNRLFLSFFGESFYRLLFIGGVESCKYTEQQTVFANALHRLTL